MAAPSCKIKTGDEVNLAVFPDQVVSFENSKEFVDDDLTCNENSQHLVDDDSSLGDSSSSGSESSYDTSDYSSSCWSSSNFEDDDKDGSDGDEDKDEEDIAESNSVSVFSLDALLALQMQFSNKSSKKDLSIFPGTSPNTKSATNNSAAAFSPSKIQRRLSRRKSKGNTPVIMTTTTSGTTPTRKFAAMKRSDSMMTFLQQDRIRRNSRLIHSNNIAHYIQQESATDGKVVQQTQQQQQETTTTPTQGKRTSVQYKKQQVFVERPQAHFEQLLQDATNNSTNSVTYKTVPYNQLSDFFVPVSPEAVAAFDATLVNAVRTQNLVELKRLHELQGRSLEARSQFGETLLHVCARRGTPELMRYMLHHAKVTFRVCCDYGRTALHDAAWSNDSQALEMMKILIHTCPDLLLIQDKRGFTPLDYIPKDRWVHACAFLDKHKEMLLPTGCLGAAATTAGK